MYRVFCCSWNYSCSCRNENIMSIVDVPNQKPHLASGYIMSASFWSLQITTLAYSSSVMLSREMSLYLLQSPLSPFVLYSMCIFAPCMSCGTEPSLKHLIRIPWTIGSRLALLHLSASAGVPSLPGAFPLDSKSNA